MKITSTELKSFFYGTLLGDSYIHNGTFYCKQISQDLINFKAKIIKENLPDVQVKVKEYEAYEDKNGVHHQKYWVLSASKSEYIKKLYNLFYPYGEKILPPGVIEHLTPLGLAMWYADDGTTILVGYNSTTGSSENRRVQFCTDSFNKEDLENASNQLSKKFGIETSLLKRRENVYRLQVLRLSKQRFFLLIYKYFLNYFPSLLYKMDLGYRNSSLKNRRYVLEEYEKLYYEISACPLFIDRINSRE